MSGAQTRDADVTKTSGSAGPIVARTAIWLAAAGVVLSSLVAYWVWGRTVDTARETLANAGEVLTGSIADALDGVGDELIAVSGLYRASHDVTRLEFTRFVDNLGQRDGVVGIAFAPVLTPVEIPGFIADVRRVVPGYEIYEFDSEGQRAPAAQRPLHAPLQWLQPDEPWDSPYGFDMYSSPQLAASMADARESGEMAATPLLQLPGQEDTDSLVLLLPVTRADAPAILGYAVGLVELGPFLESHVPPALAETVTWEVSDAPDGTREEGGEWTGRLRVADDEWEISVSGVAGSNTKADPSAALLILAAGVSASILAAFFVHAYRQRSATRDELERLRELSRSKDKFLASVGHELRTPLTGVVGFTELLRDASVDIDDEERRRMIDSVAGEATDLAAIIDDLLVAARSELDMVAVTSEPVDLGQVARVVIDRSREQKAERASVIEPAGGVIALGDPERIGQILRNLLVNACRHGGDLIEVRMSVESGSAVVEVADRGPALPVDEWERIFEPYHRLHYVETKPASLGIGLSVARHLSRLMGGDLTYRHQGGWSVFELSLPLAGEPATDETVGALPASRGH